MLPYAARWTLSAQRLLPLFPLSDSQVSTFLSKQVLHGPNSSIMAGGG